MSEEIVFEDPPPTKYGPGKWTTRLGALRERPGEWAKFQVHKMGALNAIEKAGGKYEVTTRVIDYQTWTYVRYVGPS